MYLEDTGNQGRDALNAASNQLAATRRRRAAVIDNVRGNAGDAESQLQIDIDQEKAGALGVDLSDANALLDRLRRHLRQRFHLQRRDQAGLCAGRCALSACSPTTSQRWYARNAGGEMVPFSAFATTNWTQGSRRRLPRFNGIAGDPDAGTRGGRRQLRRRHGRDGSSSSRQLPGGYGADWTGLSYQERLSGSQATLLYAISMLVVFLCLAALYESWSIPFSVILAVPVGVFGALLAAKLFGQSNDVYFKVGLLTTIGLAAKNAILIVEFAKDLRAQGRCLLEAVLEAARLRLRPIVMTSLAFILGVLPLAIATGAGSGAQNAIGIGVLGGMIAGTVLGIFFVPLFFVLISGGRKADPQLAR